MQRFRTTAQLGSLIARERKRQGLTQQQLADAAGVGVTYVIDLEHGKETAEVGKALHLLEVLSVSLYAESRYAG